MRPLRTQTRPVLITLYTLATCLLAVFPAAAQVARSNRCPSTSAT